MHALLPRVLPLMVQFNCVKIPFSTWFLIVPQDNKSMVHSGYERGYILAQQADLRTGRPPHAGHFAEKLIRHPSRD